ncbi:MAG TPA: hypothetical protein ENJ19_11380 [Gammaproteobacteria bacterium]|nr:hypothetical protein [Gammaproteobacteria bacterium]
MDNVEFWDSNRKIIRSQAGGARIGEGTAYSRGYSVLEELVGEISYFQMLVLNVTGNLVSRRLGEWIEATFLCMSWPDSRIWCNQVGAFGGTTKASPVSSVTAGILASDSKLYGPGTVRGATHFITSALRRVNEGQTLEEVIYSHSRKPGAQPTIPGYARPIAYGDERIEAMEKVRKKLRLDCGPHLELAFKVQEFLLDKHGESMNLAGYIMAFLSDQGMTAEQIYRIYALCVNNGIHACYAEAYDNPPESFLPLRCEDIEYTGHAPRPVPDK